MADELFCYLTTTGRRTGQPHTIEIWFAREAKDAHTLYLMAGARDRSDWVRNVQANADVTVRIGDDELRATARVLDPDQDADEDALARRLLLAKYQKGEELAGWGRGALPVALDLLVQ